MIRVINERRALLEQLSYLSGFDDLTGEMSRRNLTEKLSAALEDAIKFRTSLGFLVVSIDDLARVNEAYGFAVGDEVIAVGFPFGIGPSASAGIISGLKRAYRSPENKRALTNLIQFDAAANPGNSGGPLVTMDGEVVGIVTAILNPSEQSVFIGIGFAVPIENAASAVGISPF